MSCLQPKPKQKLNSYDQVVAESMNNYLMFDRLLKCSVVPKVGTCDKLTEFFFENQKAKILYDFDVGENQQGDIQRESERAEAAWKDGHVRFFL